MRRCPYTTRHAIEREHRAFFPDIHNGETSYLEAARAVPSWAVGRRIQYPDGHEDWTRAHAALYQLFTTYVRPVSAGDGTPSPPVISQPCDFDARPGLRSNMRVAPGGMSASGSVLSGGRYGSNTRAQPRPGSTGLEAGGMGVRWCSTALSRSASVSASLGLLSI